MERISVLKVDRSKPVVRWRSIRAEECSALGGDRARTRAMRTNLTRSSHSARMESNRELTRAGLMAVFALCSRPYRPDWREALVSEDRARGAAETVILGAQGANRVTREIE